MGKADMGNPGSGRQRRLLSLSTRGTRTQFFIGIIIMLILPLMTLAMLYYQHLGLMSFWNPNPHVLIAATLVLMVLGYSLIARYPATVVRLRRYLQAIIRGEMPEKVTFVEAESDIRAIEKSLNIILSQLRERVELAEREKTRLEAELKQAQKLKALGMASAGMAHELKTPIQFVGHNARFLEQTARDLLELLTTYRSLLAGCTDGDDTRAAVRSAAEAEKDAKLDFLTDELSRAMAETSEGLEYVSHAVDAMKDFSHIRDSDTKSLENINRAIQSTVTVSHNEWKHVADLELDLDPMLPPVPCMGGDIRQVFLNLIVNASQAMAPAPDGHPNGKGHIRVSTRRVEDMAEIRVSDDGPGIPEDVKNRVFEPFFTTKEVGKGTGQGLAISHSIVVDKHGGTLTFEDREDGGTVFIVRLPLESGT